MGLEDLSHNFLTGSLEELVKWARRSSVWPATFGLACCAIEMMAAGAADFDLARFGMEVFRGSPRQADLMVVAGRVSQKMAPVLRQVYDQMMEPKWGHLDRRLRLHGGMLNILRMVQDSTRSSLVDVYAPGCPPGPQDPDSHDLTLHKEVRLGGLDRPHARRDGAGINLATESLAGLGRLRPSGARSRRGRPGDGGRARARRTCSLSEPASASKAVAVKTCSTSDTIATFDVTRGLRAYGFDVRGPVRHGLPRRPRPGAARRSSQNGSRSSSTCSPSHAHQRVRPADFTGPEDRSCGPDAVPPSARFRKHGTET